MKTIIQEIYPISMIDPQYKGDKRSALQKITEDLLHTANVIAANYIWLAPVFPSPWSDNGYDVTSYYAVDPRLGTIEELETLIEAAKQFGIGILMDLVMNHTSITCSWFKNHPEYYCWSESDKPGWECIFDRGSSWAPGVNGYYLHLFSIDQADLNWFPDGPSGEPNTKLVEEFRKVVDFWVEKGIAGFRLDAMQCVNKDIASDKFDPVATVSEEYRQMAAKVINAVFDGSRADLYLLMECLDLNGQTVKYYYENTPVNAVMDNTPVNTLSITDDQSVTTRSLDSYINAVKEAYERCPEGFAFVTESHDCPRFTTAAGISGKSAIDILFGWYGANHFIDPQTIVVYQGQELGLTNPTKEELPDEKMLELDAQTRMRYERGESLDSLRPTSRANARVSIPVDKYNAQIGVENSCLQHYVRNRQYWLGNAS